MTNDFFKLGAAEISKAARWYTQHGVYSIAIQAYESMMAKGLLSKIGYLRLMALYLHQWDIINANRIKARYAKIYGI